MLRILMKSVFCIIGTYIILYNELYLGNLTQLELSFIERNGCSNKEITKMVINIYVYVLPWSAMLQSVLTLRTEETAVVCAG
jgi:hypothetical protein